MATWVDLHGYIQRNYKIMNYGPHGQIFMLFEMDNGRSQMAMVARAEDASNGEEWAKIESIVGKVNEVDVLRLLELIRYQLVGGLSKNDDYVTVRHSVPPASMSADEFEGPLGAVLDTADFLEQSVSIADRY